MKYYDSNGNLIEYKESDLRYFNNGQTANIYRLTADELLKRYYTYAPTNLRIDESLFNYLDNLNNPHLVKILELYKDESLESVIAYLMQFIESDFIDYLDSPSELLLSHISDIEILINLLTKDYIRVMDLKNTNAITTKKGIIIIDPDKYRKVDYNPVIANKDQLLYLAYSILNYGKSRLKDELDRVKLLEFRSSIKINETDDITSQLAKTLVKGSKPIDIFRRAS